MIYRLDTKVKTTYYSMTIEYLDKVMTKWETSV